MQRVSINGIITQHVPVMDRGLQYGDGLFETIACIKGALQFWEEHIQRMHAGANRLGIEFPGADSLLHDINPLCNDLPDKNFIVKILLTRGQGTRGYRAPELQTPTRIVIITDWPEYSPELAHTGVKLCLCKHTVSVNPHLAGIKHLNRLDNVIARNEWNDEFHEGLMTDLDGNVIEGTMSNVFGIKGNTLYTPDLERSGVDGIIRNQVLSIACAENIEIRLCNISVDDLYSMDELFITNSIIGIWPVRLIEEHQYQVGETTLKLANGLHRRMLKHAKILA